MMIHPVILSGGVGTRLWPLSRRAFPKQLSKLIGDDSLLQATVRRISSNGFAAPMVICNQEHRFVIAEQLREVERPESRLVLEPVGRNTAPATAVAALLAREQDHDAVVALLPSDHWIPDADAFRAAINTAAAAASDGYLVTFGFRPTAPKTGYGYIERSDEPAGAGGVMQVSAFLEKPDAQRATRFMASGRHYWNSGMFVFSADALLDEMARLEPEMLQACEAACRLGRQDLDFFRLHETSFSQARSVSIDYAVMERTHQAAVLPVEFQWNDLGAWSSLWDIGEKDDAGNVVTGQTELLDVENSIVHAEGQLVGALGVSNLIVAATRDAVLVADRTRAEEVKQLVDNMRSAKQPQVEELPIVFRPWGSYQSIDQGRHFQVKRLTINPGSKISLQRHQHRAEHWVVVTGTARITRGTEIFDLTPNQSTYIPRGEIHRLENPADQPLEVIEVQSGNYLEEDDIERFEDEYGRIPSDSAT